jgi:membrane protease YdiL (CAAX protease family)
MKDHPFIRCHPLTAFFLSVYAISWSGILIVLAALWFRGDAMTLTGQGLIFLAMVAGPSISGLVFVASMNQPIGLRKLWASMKRWQVNARWFAMAVFTVPALMCAILQTFRYFVSPVYAPQMQWTGLVVALLAGVFEETGWSGFATPRLLDRSHWFSSGLVLGIVWACGICW